MNRERFERHELVRKVFNRVVGEGVAEGLIGDDRFSVDGTLKRSMAGSKSLKPIDEESDDLNSWGEFKGKKRSNKTHRSVVDPEARLASRGGEAHLCHSMHMMTQSRSGLCVSVTVDVADGMGERRNALGMLDRARKRHALRPRVIAAAPSDRRGRGVRNGRRLVRRGRTRDQAARDDVTPGHQG